MALEEILKMTLKPSTSTGRDKMKNFKYLALIALILTACQISTPMSGQKIGRIVKISDEGLFWKSCEGELIRGGFVDGSGSMGGSFHFTIENHLHKDIAYKAFESQQEVIITYDTPFVTSLTRTDYSPPHFVKNITIVGR